MATRGKRTNKSSDVAPAKSYTHKDQTALMRPDVGTQAQFKKRKDPKRYSYDHPIPLLQWDGENIARERGESLIREILDLPEVKLSDDLRQRISSSHGEPIVAALNDALSEAEGNVRAAKAAAEKLRRMSQPFLEWTGKKERSSFDLPTLPLFVHERLSTKAIIDTLQGHKRDKQMSLDLFGDPEHSITDQVLKAYEHQDRWVNRMILGDSLVVMNSLLQYESMAGKVQMIYMDPPYGVKFGSNFQPFVRKRDVSHGDDEDMTREPEMVQAYRDTWELGTHSYLSYLRDRLSVSRDLLGRSGSIFVQISDDNLHHVRGVLDEVFGQENFVAVINFKTMMPLESGDIESVVDYLCWYAKDKSQMKYHNLYVHKKVGTGSEFVFADTDDGGYRRLSAEEVANFGETAGNNRVFKRSDLTSSGYTPSCTFPITFEKKTFQTKRGKSWRTTPNGVETLKNANRLFVLGSKIYFKVYVRDFGFGSLTNQWSDTIESAGRLYVVQTTASVVQRCLLMTTDPGDLVLDPTCGSGTTAYVAEQWGRRWVTTDVSRVPLALARQRLLTATFPYYDLKDQDRPSSGFVYKRRQNRNGEEVGGIVPHITLRSIANNEPPEEEVLVDRPELVTGVTRVTGPFCFESTIPTPTPVEFEAEAEAPTATHTERMLEILRKSPMLRLPGNRTVTFKNVRQPAKALSLSAEATVANGRDKVVAFVFGPENGAVSERLVYDAAREANLKGYEQLFVIGFAVEAKARTFIERCTDVVGVPAVWVQATTDLTMSDLLKTMRSSQIFSVSGLPDVMLTKHTDQSGEWKYRVHLLGVDLFDPVSMEVEHYGGDEAADQQRVPAWFLDVDYNDLCFHVSQAFFPRTSAWDNLRRSLRGTFEDSVWSHLAGMSSEPFFAGDHQQVAVKVIDDRGNELMVVAKLSDAAVEKSAGEKA